MTETLEELTYDYEEDGRPVRKQIDRAVFAKGGWATLMFLFQELDRASGKFRAPKMAIVRLRKSRGVYRKQSSFTISSEKEAREIGEVFARWSPRMLADLADGESRDGSQGGDGDGDGDDHDAPAAED